MIVMEIRYHSWVSFLTFGGLVYALSAVLFWRIQPPSRPHNKQVSDVDPQDCVWNSTKDINDDVDTFLSCFKVYYADRYANGSKDGVHLPACVTRIVGNISLELYLLQMTNDSDYERLTNTREKLLRTFRELEACVLEVTEREECPCLSRFNAALLDRIKLLVGCFRERYGYIIITTHIITHILGSFLLVYYIYDFIANALPTPHQQFTYLSVFVFHTLVTFVTCTMFLKKLMPFMLGYPPFAGRIVHVDLDEIMGRELNSVKTCKMEELKWRYPGEDACIHCSAGFQFHEPWLSSMNLSEMKIVWLLNGKPAAFSRRHSILYNKTGVLSDGSVYVVRSVRISNLKKSDFGKYECIPDQKGFSTFKLPDSPMYVEILKIPSKRVNITIPPGGVLRIHISHVNFFKSLGHWANVTLSVNNGVVANGRLYFPMNVKSCSAMTAFLDLLIVAVEGLGHPSGESPHADMVTLCVSFQHYGVHQLHLERFINGVRATSRHPVSIEVTRRLGDKVASGQVQTSDEDLQNSYSILREVLESLLVLALLEVHDVIQLMFTALLLWAFLAFIRYISPFLASNEELPCKVYVISSKEEETWVGIFVVDFLESLGHQVYFHDRDCPLGTPHMTSIKKAIQYYQKFIVVVSEHFFEDRLCLYQWDVISDELRQRQTSEPTNQASNRLLIIRSGDVGLPTPTHGAHLIQWETCFRTVDVDDRSTLTGDVKSVKHVDTSGEENAPSSVGGTTATIPRESDIAEDADITAGEGGNESRSGAGSVENMRGEGAAGTEDISGNADRTGDVVASENADLSARQGAAADEDIGIREMILLRNLLNVRAWVNETFCPEVTVKHILFVSCVVTFSNPMFLTLLPYRSELCDIFWSFSRSL